MGFPGASDSKESALQGGIPGFDSWVGKIPCRKEMLPIQVFWPGEFHGCIAHGVTKSGTQLSYFHFTSVHML